VTEVSAVSATTVRLSPLELADSQQIRLKRLYPGASYRATTNTVAVPIPRDGDGIGAPRIRDEALVQMVAGLLLNLDAQAEHADISKYGGNTVSDDQRKPR
jgi:hypothetical protein